MILFYTRKKNFAAAGPALLPKTRFRLNTVLAAAGPLVYNKAVTANDFVGVSDMNFDPLLKSSPSGRFCVTARNGMVSASNNMASAAGLSILRKGGNAVDAAIAAAAALTVLEPVSNGLGSDSFAIVWMKDKMYGLNASGYAPSGISAGKVAGKYPGGKMPIHGWTPVTVPGAPAAWAALCRRFGKLSLEEDLEPAISYARDGFPVTPMLSFLLRRITKSYRAEFGNAPEYSEWFRVFTKNGESYEFGDMIRLPDHARSLRLIARSEAEEFYRGEIARQLVRQSTRDGGYFTFRDLAGYEPLWVEPVSVNYRGYDVWEIPPNGQGLVVLMTLNILKNFTFSRRNDISTLHTQFEAMKMGFADGMHYVTDPRYMGVDYHDLITPQFGRERAAEITELARQPEYKQLSGGGTVYLCTADQEGNMVSYIQSNFNDFGSGIVVEGYGVALQDRGADFSLDPASCNYLQPGKRTYHTIIPGFLTKDGRAVGPFGVMGCYMQPQGQTQVVTNMIDFHMNPQMALDTPRWQWINGMDFQVEDSFDHALADELRKRGHRIEYADPVG